MPGFKRRRIVITAVLCLAAPLALTAMLQQVPTQQVPTPPTTTTFGA